MSDKYFWTDGIQYWNHSRQDLIRYDLKRLAAYQGDIRPIKVLSAVMLEDKPKGKGKPALYRICFDFLDSLAIWLTERLS